MQIFNTSIIELAVISALVSLFLDFCFRDGNIFAGWLDFLADMHTPEDAMNLDRDDRFELVEWFWFKPLGGCVVCMNVWISFVVCAIWLIFGGFNWWEVLPVVLLSNFIVRFFHEKIV